MPTDTPATPAPMTLQHFTLDDLAVYTAEQAFDEIGWPWGGDWRSLKDYQHFSANGL